MRQQLLSLSLLRAITSFGNYSIYQYKIRSNWRTGSKGSLFAPKLKTLGYDSDGNAAQVRLAVSKNQKTIQ